MTPEDSRSAPQSDQDGPQGADETNADEADAPGATAASDGANGGDGGPNGPTETAQDVPEEGAAGVIYYQEIDFLGSVDNPWGLLFVAAPGPKKAPEAMVRLRREFSATTRVVNVLFAKDREYRANIYLDIHRVAHRAFTGVDFNLDDGADGLVDVHNTIIDRAHKLRDRLFLHYTIFGAIFGVAPLLIAIAFMTDGFGYFPVVDGNRTNEMLFAWVLASLLITAGASICVWAEFAMRMDAGLTFDKLLNMDPGRWRPSQRLLITVGISFIFAYLLYFNVFQIGLGGVLLNEFLIKHPFLSLGIGGVTGLAFVSVRELISQAKPTNLK